ncbi:unnamed protein product [Lupinus luteus]|uniref:Transmembrane protein n=1 Tax=Lupinus luteus TaxID=3873 RepID=A0AAV1WLF0_LUPLU
MNDNHPQLQNLRSTSLILREASFSFSSNLITFLFLSLLILSFRTLVENGTYQVTSFIDRDPSLKAILSRIDLNHRWSDLSVHRRRRPFLHLTRVNGSFVAFGPFNHDSGFSNLVTDDGISVSEIVRSGITFKENNALSFAEEDEDKEMNTDYEEKRENIDDDFYKKEEKEKNGDLGSDQREMEKMFSSVTGLVWDGSRLGLKRLSGFILMKWAVRDALTQLIGLWYFGEIEDQYSFFKLFVSLKLMPFSVMSTWVRRFEKKSSWFLFTLALVDIFVAFIFSVDAWVAIVESRMIGREIVKEGYYLISTMFNQAMQIKCLESVVCGSFMRWILGRVCGRSFAKLFQSTVEVYFMVVWLLFYFAARCRDANLQGKRFGLRELEGLIEGHR